MRKFFRLPSPSMIVACCALFVALSGTAVAASTLAKNSVGSKQLKKNAVTSTKIKSNSITGSKVKDGSLTGADINLGSVGTVPKATSADSAGTAGSAGSVNGVKPAKVSYQGASGAAATPFFSAGGLTLSGSCIGGTLEVTAATSSNDGFIHVSNGKLEQITTANQGNKTVYDEDDSFDVGDTFDVLPDGNIGANLGSDSVQGTLTYASATGTIITITHLAEEQPNALGGANDCFYLGTADIS